MGGTEVDVPGMKCVGNRFEGSVLADEATAVHVLHHGCGGTPREMGRSAHRSLGAALSRGQQPVVSFGRLKTESQLDSVRHLRLEVSGETIGRNHIETNPGHQDHTGSLCFGVPIGNRFEDRHFTAFGGIADIRLPRKTLK